MAGGRLVVPHTAQPFGDAAQGDLGGETPVGRPSNQPEAGRDVGRRQRVGARHEDPPDAQPRPGLHRKHQRRAMHLVRLFQGRHHRRARVPLVNKHPRHCLAGRIEARGRRAAAKLFEHPALKRAAIQAEAAAEFDAVDGVQGRQRKHQPDTVRSRLRRHGHILELPQVEQMRHTFPHQFKLQQIADTHFKQPAQGLGRVGPPLDLECDRPDALPRQGRHVGSRLRAGRQRDGEEGPPRQQTGGEAGHQKRYLTRKSSAKVPS